MKAIATATALLLATLAAAPAVANFSGGSKSDEPEKPASQGISSFSMTPREEAERLYADGRDEAMKAKNDLQAGKTKNAEKKFKKALDRGERAVAIDPKYHEAWNLIGYTSRKLNDYDKAFKAYEKCLAIKWDYAPAREYLGEAWLEKGDLAKAREQMVMLDRIEAETEMKVLKGKIDAYLAAHPEAAPAPAPATETAKADSTSGSQH